MEAARQLPDASVPLRAPRPPTPIRVRFNDADEVIDLDSAPNVIANRVVGQQANAGILSSSIPASSIPENMVSTVKNYASTALKAVSPKATLKAAKQILSPTSKKVAPPDAELKNSTVDSVMELLKRNEMAMGVNIASNKIVNDAGKEMSTSNLKKAIAYIVSNDLGLQVAGDTAAGIPYMEKRLRANQEYVTIIETAKRLIPNISGKGKPRGRPRKSDEFELQKKHKYIKESPFRAVQWKRPKR